MPALDLRRLITAIVQSEGVRTSTDLQVAQRGAGANMSVDISSGFATIQGDVVAGQGFYFAYNDAVYNLSGFTAANATNPRIDRVVIRVRDAFHGDPANDVSFQILTGTATSGANLSNLTGAAAVGNSQLLLANILVPANATSITTGNIANVAPVSGIGGVSKLAWVGYPVGSTNTTPTANAAILVPFTLYTTQTIDRVHFVSGTQSGNFDVGVFDSAGARKVSKGSTAQSTLAAGANEVTFTATQLNAGQYYLALAADNATGTFRFDGSGVNAGTAKYYQRQVATSFPLPSSLTVGTTTPAQALMLTAPAT